MDVCLIPISLHGSFYNIVLLFRILLVECRSWTIDDARFNKVKALHLSRKPSGHHHLFEIGEAHSLVR